MRDLMKPANVIAALLGGLLVGGACVPFITFMTYMPRLQLLRVAFLFPLTILCYQVSTSWTELARSKGLWQGVPTWVEARNLALAGVAIGGASFVFVDPKLRGILPGYYPDSLGRVLLGLPWMALFQPLVFVATPYAFAARLTRNPMVASVAVVLVHQGVSALQIGAGPAVTVRVMLLTAAGLSGVVLAASFQTLGLAGPMAISAVIHLRHILNCL